MVQYFQAPPTCFERSGGAWSQQAYLKASNAEMLDFFGTSLAASSDTLVVGASNEAGGATGVNGDQADNSALGSGAAYVFQDTGGAWSQVAYLKASNTDAGDNFGQGVGVSGDTVVVGVPLEQSSATGVNGDHTDNSSFTAGAAYVFRLTGGAWSQSAYLKASNTDPGDHFAFAVGVSDDLYIVGSPLEASNAAGINGIQADNSLMASGASYIFEVAPGPCLIGFRYCDPATINSTGLPGALTASGFTSLATNQMTLDVRDLPLGTTGIFLARPDTRRGPESGQQPGHALPGREHRALRGRGTDPELWHDRYLRAGCRPRADSPIQWTRERASR